MKRFRMLSHNAFWFQGHPYDGDIPDAPSDAVFQGLLSIYRGLAPDALCLQEVQGQEVCSRLAGELGMYGAYCRGGAFPQYGGSILWKHGRAGHDTTTSPPAFQRFWQMATIELPHSVSIRVCNLHLASARHLGPEGGGEARVADMQSLVEHEHDPEIIAGDFNEPPGGPVEDVLTRHGYVDVAPLTGILPESTGINKRRSDQIWVHDTVRDRVAGFGMVGFDDLGAGAAGKLLLSDHCPLWLDLQ